MPIKITHVIIGLDVGGAEIALKRLILSHSNNSSYFHQVISLTTLGKIGNDLKANGIQVTCLGLNSFINIPRIFFRLIKIFNTENPDIVQTWMYHANLLGGLAAKFSGVKKIAWGIRNVSVPQSFFSLTNFIVFSSSLLSYFIPNMIICCATSALKFHSRIGYCSNKMIVLNNGFDFSNSTKKDQYRTEIRSMLQIHDDEFIIGNIGRFDSLKDQRNFILAAKSIAEEFCNIKFLMVGRNIHWQNSILSKWLLESGCSEKFLLVGEQDNVFKYLSAMDIYCLSSRSEGFPNVLCEAMMMRVPCVSTSAGDASTIINDAGIVVPISNPLALSLGLKTLILESPEYRREISDRAFHWVMNNYSLQIYSAKAANIYDTLINS